ncbi:MAG: DUF115 domain-containing protein [Candidatus Electrothrix communis]|nr:MAG: DUF115 domain-containing protein [Candidatus Electrothrix communis]
MDMTKLIRSIFLFSIPHGLVVGWWEAKQFIRARSENGNKKKNEFELFQSNLRSYKDTCQKEECFIIGAGSSIKKQNIEDLAGKKCITVSNVYVHPAITSISPAYHILPNIFKHHSRLYGEKKFIDWLSDMNDRLPLSTKIIMDIADKVTVEKVNLFQGREVLWYGCTHWNEEVIDQIVPETLPNVWSVSETAIAIAIYFGFSPIYLLGMDHDWFNGIFNYFYDHKMQHKVGLDESKVDFADSEFQMRRHAYIFKKYKELYRLHGKIFNCNYDQSSYVDVFPKIKLKQALGL